MANYREILRLDSLGSSQRRIAREVKSSRDTVAEAIKAAEAACKNGGIRPSARGFPATLSEKSCHLAGGACQSTANLV